MHFALSAASSCAVFSWVVAHPVSTVIAHQTVKAGTHPHRLCCRPQTHKFTPIKRLESGLVTDLKRIGAIRNKFTHSPDTLTCRAQKVLCHLDQFPNFKRPHSSSRKNCANLPAWRSLRKALRIKAYESAF